VAINGFKLFKDGFAATVGVAFFRGEDGFFDIHFSDCLAHSIASPAP